MDVVETHAFHPPKSSSYDDDAYNSFDQQIHEFGELEPRFVPIHYLFFLAGTSETPDRDTPVRLLRKTTILYFHGNACDIGSLEEYGQRMSRQCDVNFVAVEYPGYGCSTKVYGANKKITPSEKWTYFAVDAILSELSSVWGIEESDIVLMGKSIGSGPAVEFACQDNRKFLGLIIDSGFTSCVRIRYNLPSWLHWCSDNLLDIFVNVHKLPNVNCKTLLLHAQQDKIVPLEHAMQNWDQIPEEMQAKFVVFDKAAHNTVELLYDENGDCTDKMNPKYVMSIKEFLSELKREQRDNM